MTIQSGCSMLASDIKTLQTKQLIINGQEYFNALKISGLQYNYDNINGIDACTGRGCDTILCDYGSARSTCCYILCQTDACIDLTCVDCALNVPHCYLGCTTASGGVNLRCVCNDSKFCLMTCCCCGSGGSGSGAVEFYNLNSCRGFADYYMICFAAHTEMASGVCTTCNINTIEFYFGGCKLYCCVHSCSQAKYSAVTCSDIAAACYEFCKVPGTYTCYCYFKDGAFQCCIDQGNTTCCNLYLRGSWSFSASSVNLAKGQARLIITGLKTCYNTTRRGLVMCSKNYGGVVNSIYLMDGFCSGCGAANNCGCILYELMCTDNATPMGICITPWVLCDISACGLCCFGFRIYNCCSPNYCMTPPPWIICYARTITTV
jgi:hypothetical protein